MKSIRLVALALMFFLVFAGHVVFIGTLAGQTGDERKATSDDGGAHGARKGPTVSSVSSGVNSNFTAP
jgi:hypothetical protein